MSTLHSVAMKFVPNPLVTIAIPTFNRASWLSECISVALSQSYPRFEVLVLDNASTDDTQDVLRTFKDERLRVVRNETNIGLVPNWNACLLEAKGDFIVFVADDDRIPPWMLERFLEFPRQDPSVTMVLGQTDVFYVDEGKTARPQTDLKIKTGLYDGVDILDQWLRGNIVLSTTSIMFHTEAFRASGGFPLDIRYAFDMAGLSRLLLTSRVGFITESSATWAVHHESVTSRLTIDERLNDWRKFRDLVAEMADSQIADLTRRGRVKLAAKRFFARHAMLSLCNYRREGTDLGLVLSVIWRFRHDLSYIGGGDAFGLARSLARILCPNPIADLIRRSKKSYSGQLDRMPA